MRRCQIHRTRPRRPKQANRASARAATAALALLKGCGGNHCTSVGEVPAGAAVVFQPTTSPSHPRRAVVTAMVLVVMVITAGLMAEFIRRAVTDRRQTRQDVAYQQTIQLASAGVRRARQRLNTTDAYDGETWDVAAGVVHPTDTAQVTIAINEGDRTAVVVARYPANLPHPNQITRTISLPEQAQQ